MSQQDARPMITMQEAARRTGVSRMTIWRWANQGRIRGYRLGDHLVRVDEEDVGQLVRPLADDGRVAAAG